MELAKQVTSLDISKKLEELQFFRDSHFTHYNSLIGVGKHRWIIIESYKLTECKYEKYLAYTASELMEHLTNPFQMFIEKDIDKYLVETVDFEGYKIKFTGETLVDALGNLFIYLFSNNLIDGNHK